jgi:hypothetical protein
MIFVQEKLGVTTCGKQPRIDLERWFRHNKLAPDVYDIHIRYIQRVFFSFFRGQAYGFIEGNCILRLGGEM